MIVKLDEPRIGCSTLKMAAFPAKMLVRAPETPLPLMASLSNKGEM